MDGDEIRQRREALGWTQERLAQEVRVGPRTIGNWERGTTVPKNRMGRLRKVLDAGQPNTDPLRSLTDAELLKELLRRALDRG